MKVIFIKDLKKQGKVNQVKEVSDGYAINYLIKNGYAVKYTKTSSSILDKDIKDKEERDEMERKRALELKKEIEGIVLEFKVESNKGRVFGSISSKQICELLREKNINIDKKMIKVDGNISSLGMHNVCVNLYKGIVANLRIRLVEK